MVTGKTAPVNLLSKFLILFKSIETAVSAMLLSVLSATLVSGGTQLGYTPSGMEGGFELSTLFPDYSMTGMPEWTGYILSAVVGVALLVIFFKIISSLMKDKVDFKKKAA